MPAQNRFFTAPLNIFRKSPGKLKPACKLVIPPGARASTCCDLGTPLGKSITMDGNMKNGDQARPRGCVRAARALPARADEVIE